jgi:hypothetical protein
LRGRLRPPFFLTVAALIKVRAGRCRPAPGANLRKTANCGAVTPSLWRDAVTPRSENSAGPAAAVTVARPVDASGPSGHCVLQLQEHRPRGKLGSRPSRLILLGIPPGLISRTTVRRSVLRMTCGSRSLPMDPPHCTRNCCLNLGFWQGGRVSGGTGLAARSA